MFENANPRLQSLSVRIECPFDSGIGVECEGHTPTGTVYPEPDMDALSDYIDELKKAHPGERFNIVTIRTTNPRDVIVERTYDPAFQREAEDLVRD